jgi:hypothetical protein
MQDASADLAGIHNYDYLADLTSIERIPAKYRKTISERGCCIYDNVSGLILNQT